MLLSYLLSGASLVTVCALAYLLSYRLQKLKDRRCRECGYLRVVRTHKMYPAARKGDEAQTARDPLSDEKWSVFIFKKCPRCGKMSLDRSEDKYFSPHQLKWRRAKQPHTFVHEEQLFRETSISSLPWVPAHRENHTAL